MVKTKLYFIIIKYKIIFENMQLTDLIDRRVEFTKVRPVKTPNRAN